MIPAVFIFLDALPLLPNGKIHLWALPAPASFEFGTGSATGALNNDLEKTIAGIWQQVLNVRRVGSTDNFFDLGGDSLSLVQVYRNLRTKGAR